MSNVSGDAASFFAGNNGAGEEVLLSQNHFPGNSDPNSLSPNTTHHSGSPTEENPPKRKRNQPGNPDPNAEVISLSPSSLLATHRFICEVCNKGFQRDQNLQLHRRGHNLPWKLKARPSDEPPRKKVYVCPEPSCVHHNPQRALGDLTGIKKHYCRKHGEKKYRCDKCSKKYAVYSDWKAHTKICGTKDYKCECGTIFSRKDSYLTHRAFCDALMEENQRASSNLELMANLVCDDHHENLMSSLPIHSNADGNGLSHQPMCCNRDHSFKLNKSTPLNNMAAAAGNMFSNSSALGLGSLFGGGGSAAAASISATEMLQKAAQMSATESNEYGGMNSPLMMSNKTASMAAPPFFMQPLPENLHHPGGGLVNMLLTKQKSPQQEMPSQFLPTSNTNAGHHGHDIGGFEKFQLELQDLASLPLMKKYGQDEKANSIYNIMNNTKTFLPGATDPDSSPTAATLGGSGGGGPGSSYFLPTGLPTRFGADRMTVDFLGIGGGSRPRGISSLHDHHDMNFSGGIGQPRMQGLNQFQQQHAAMEKPMWKV